MYSKRKRLVVASVAIVAFLVVFSTVQCGLSSPITTPVVVKMDDSFGVNIASETLKENMPVTMIVDYNSPAYYFVIWRAYGGVIWVGHGSQEGIETEQGLMSWEALAARVESTPSKDAALVCYSATILNYVNRSQIIASFQGEMDARLGALLTAHAFTGDKAILRVALQHVSGMLRGAVQPVLLGYLLSSSWLTGRDTGINNWEATQLMVDFTLWMVFQVILGSVVPVEEWGKSCCSSAEGEALQYFVCKGIPAITDAVIRAGGWLDNRGTTIANVAAATAAVVATVLVVVGNLIWGTIVACFNAAIAVMAALWSHNFWLALAITAIFLATILIPPMYGVKAAIAISGAGWLAIEFLSFYLG